MENFNYDERPVFYFASHKKPAFYLIRYGDIINISCNEEVASRLSNILGDYVKNSDRVSPLLTSFKQHLKLMVAKREEKCSSHSDEGSYLCNKLSYVYSIIIDKSFARNLSGALDEFLVHNKISPSMYSLARQLSTIVKIQNKPLYVDEIYSDDDDEDDYNK